MPQAEAKIGILTHAFNYGTGVFEGIRAYWNADQQQLYVFKLREHYQRLHESCHILHIKLAYSVDALSEITNGGAAPLRGARRHVPAPDCLQVR